MVFLRFVCLVMLFLLIDCRLPAYGVENFAAIGSETFLLPSGMRVFFIKKPDMPVVLHMVIYKAGGLDDFSGSTGVAHYLEHLMFSGTSRFPDVPGFMASIGAQFNAVTTHEFTAYFEIVAKSSVDKVMKFEADRMANLKLSSSRYVEERSIVRSEREMRVDTVPESFFQEKLMRILKNGPYGRPVVGWDSDLLMLSRDAAEAFYRTYYSPDNAVLLVIGDLDSKDVRRMALENYGDVRVQRCDRSCYSPRDPSDRDDSLYDERKVLSMESDNVPYDILFMVYSGAPGTVSDEHDVVPFNIGMDILVGKPFSPLYKDLVVEKKLCTSIDYAYTYDTYTSGVVMLRAALRDGVKFDDVEKEIRGILSDFRFQSVGDMAFEAARNSYRADFMFRLDDSLFNLGLFYAYKILLLNHNGHREKVNVNFDPYFSAVESVSRESISAAFGDLFSEHDGSSGITGSHKNMVIGHLKKG